MSARKLRVLVVDHVTKVMGGAEVNLVELLDHPGVRETWATEVACRTGSPLHQSLETVGCVRHDYGFGASLNELRVVGRGFSPAAKWRGWQEVQRARRSLESIIRKAQPDVVLSCTNKDHFTAGGAAKTCGVPSVWWVNDILSADFFSWPVRKVFVHQARRLATTLAPVSNFGRDALIREGVPGDRITTVHNGISLAKYVRDPARPLRQELGLKPGEPLFGILGRITPWKGQDRFVDLAVAWKASGRPGCFAIIGRAFNEDQLFDQGLRRCVEERGLGDVVRFVPFQAGVASVLSSLDVLIHTSTKPEPFGRVLIEAMAVGTPVLAARAGGVPEIVEPGVNGELAMPGDLEDYLSKLTRMVQPGHLSELSLRTRASVEPKFSLDRVAVDFTRIFDAVAGGKRA